MTGNYDESARGWRSIRFTISELLLFIAALAIGLGYARVDGSDAWFDFLLACFGGCFIVGHVQKSWERWRQRKTLPKPSLVDMLLPLGLAVLMIFAGAMRAADRHKWWGFQYNGNDASWVSADFIETLFYLAVFCGYLQRYPPGTRARRSLFTARLIDAAVILLAAYWIRLLLESGTALLPLVHVAIHGVELAQPTRLAGEPFYSVQSDIRMAGELMDRGICTGLILTTGAFAAIALGRQWARGLTCRMLWSMLCFACIAAVSYQLHWCLSTGFPQYSPFLYSAFSSIPPGDVTLAVAVIAAASVAFSARVCATPHPDPPSHAEFPASRPYLYQWIGVPLVFLLAATCSGATALRESFGLSYWWNLPFIVVQITLSHPRWMLWTAALIVVGQQVWRWWRPTTTQEVRWTVPTARFAVVLFFALWIGLLLIPAAPWLGFALYLRRAGL